MQGALGLIEVQGYLGAISSCDAALKAANVTLLNAEKISGGLTTIELSGDVGAVRAAVEAGVTVAQTLGVLVSSHVIARVDQQTASILTASKKQEQLPEPKEEKVGSLEQETVANLRKIVRENSDKLSMEKSKIKYATKQELIQEIRQLKK